MKKMFVVKVKSSFRYTFWYRNEIGTVFCVYIEKRLNEYCLVNDSTRILFKEDCKILGEVVKIKKKKG